MPKYTGWLYSPRLHRQFRPTRNEVFMAEKILRDSIDKKDPMSAYLRGRNGVFNDSIYQGYFRQYGGCRKHGHRIIYILMVSKTVQWPLEKMKRQWRLGIMDGGSILYHIYIDLNEKKVISIRDNGVA
jgi:hypothetical protein